ncbi:unnamed protein product [Candidula unifasciata]|uniref:Up-regulated during skeletal muscle growth protein 5 n=1 Tax=Candidula unifasciata TaxID=100452 RepID=A0A8S3ZGI9_9EUPU|nr:unnamed protein product [Candidula unifasciata]
MAGDFVPEEELNLKGFQKYFNSYTLRGRFNIVVATYSTLFLMILLYKLNQPPKRNLPQNKQAKSKSPDVSPRCTQISKCNK